MTELSLTPSEERAIRRRTRRDPNPRFKPDRTHQLDAVKGCPALMVPEDHVARAVLRIVEKIDLSAVEAKYSSLGKHGFAPRNVLAVWVYASLIGVHHGTELARRLETDAALRLLSGGYAIKRSKLNQFRAENATLFASAIDQTVAMAKAEGLLAVDEMALDSMRLRAHASNAQVRMLSRSTSRLEELRAVDPSTLTDEERARHKAKVEKHTKAIADCQRLGRTSVVTTNPSAVVMKFPDGGAMPGHRVTAMAAGAKARIIVAVLVSADATDSGLLEPIVNTTLATLARLGLSDEKRPQASADAGYGSSRDLSFAERARDQIDLLVDVTQPPGPRPEFFGRDRFIVGETSATCPAGRAMKGAQASGRIAAIYRRGLRRLRAALTVHRQQSADGDGELCARTNAR